MPRKLPWVTQWQPALVSSSKRPATTPKPHPKRAKLSESVSDSDATASPIPSRKPEPKNSVRTPPSSPPLENIPERFMREGMDHDDKYRIVEDEFLAIAQQFTVHLHAAEYKRQEKMAKARNAETISSISRPVTGKMPDSTKRKVEGIARSKAQQNTIQRLLGEKPGAVEDPYDSSDGEGLAYFETTLRGLMDSPGRKAASLSKLPYGVATRAAAGFQKPAAQLKQQLSVALESPNPKSSLKLGQSSKSDEDSSTDSPDIDDDLDAPVPSSKFTALDTTFVPTSSSHSSSRPHIRQPQRLASPQKPTASKPSVYVAKSSLGNSTVAEGSTKASSIDSTTDSTTRVRRRLMQGRLRDLTRDKVDQDKKKLDVIPTFL